MENTAHERHRDFGKRFIGGLSWTVGAQATAQVVTLVSSILLARLLVPKDFGILSMALAYIGFLFLVGQTGLNSAIVYLDEVSALDLHTMYWANLAVSLFLFILAVLLAPLIGTFFHSPQVVPVIRFASLLLVVSALGGVQKTLLEKRMDFRGLARNQLAASIVYSVTAVTLAIAGIGVWSLVVAKVLEQVTDSVLAAFGSRWWPRFAFSRISFRRLMSYGGRVWVGNVLFYGQENIDNLVVGRVLGATMLGFYSFAFRLANAPRYFFAGVISRVMFPIFSSGRGQIHTLKKAYLRINAYSILAAGGLCTGLAMVASEAIRVLYGPKWVPATTTLRIVAIAAGVYGVSQIAAPALMAMGKPEVQAKLVGTSSLVLLVGALVGVRFGIVGVAVSVLVAASVALGLAQYSVARTLGVGRVEYVRAVLPPAVGIGAMCLAVVVWRSFGYAWFAMSGAVWLVIAVLLGGAALIGGFLLADPRQVSDFGEFLRPPESGSEPVLATSPRHNGQEAQELV